MIKKVLIITATIMLLFLDLKMADVKIIVPATTDSFYSDSDVPQVKSKLSQIYATYQDIIDNISSITNVPVNVILSFIFIESGGNQNVVSGSGAVGLMQLIPSSASDILVLEKKKNRLQDSEKAILTQYLGDRFTKGIMKMKYLGNAVSVDGVTSAVWVNKNDLQMPELSILIGAIFIGLLMDENTESISGNIRMDIVSVKYNRGIFAKSGLDGDINYILANQPQETSDYIRKLLGVNGILQMLA